MSPACASYDKAIGFLARVNKLRTLGVLVDVGAAAFGLPTFGAGSRAAAAIEHYIEGEADAGDANALKEGAKAAKSLLRPKKANSPPEEIDAFRREFGELLDGLGKTVVVFVDNLDRCMPTQTIHTLEALRLFLFMNQTAFVVAADEDMVRHAVSQHFKDASKNHVTDYLDKLIQIPVRVPRLGITEVRAYLFMLLASAGNAKSADVESLRRGLEENLRLSWSERPITAEQAVKLLAESATDEIAASFHMADRMAHLLAVSSSVNGNPRIVKRLLNVVRMRGGIARRRKMPVDEALIAKLALFERCIDEGGVAYLYSEINAAAAGKPAIIETLEGLIDNKAEFDKVCPEAWKSRGDFVHEWLALSPPLKHKDLRPLVYLSRETTPLRTYSATLSAGSAEAVRVLARASSTASPTAKAAVQSIPDGEHAEVMRELIANMRSHGEWVDKPSGFSGAVLLAEYRESARELLVAFLKQLSGNTPPWLKLTLQNAKWYPKAGG